jgi:polynucleotide 5'-kinase involved in rRNA processing
MKQYKLTVDQLVTYLKSYIVDATPAQQDAFRSGFIASAMPNAAETYDQAMQQAAPAPQS